MQRSWQSARGVRSTGYLDGPQVEALRGQGGSGPPTSVNLPIIRHTKVQVRATTNRRIKVLEGLDAACFSERLTQIPVLMEY